MEEDIQITLGKWIGIEVNSHTMQGYKDFGPDSEGKEELWMFGVDLPALQKNTIVTHWFHLALSQIQLPTPQPTWFLGNFISSSKMISVSS